MNKTTNVPLLPATMTRDFPIAKHFLLFGRNHLYSVLGEDGLLDMTRGAYANAGKWANHWFTLNLFGAALAVRLGIGKTLAMKAGMVMYVWVSEIDDMVIKDYVPVDLKSGIMIIDNAMSPMSTVFSGLTAGKLPSIDAWASIAMHLSIFTIAMLIRFPVNYDVLYKDREPDRVLNTVSRHELNNFAKVLYCESSLKTKARIAAVGAGLSEVFEADKISPEEFDELAEYGVIGIDGERVALNELPEGSDAIGGYVSPEQYLAELKALMRNMKDWDEKDFWNEMTFIYAKAKLGEDVKTMKQILELKGKAMGVLEQQPQGNTNNIVVLTNEAISTLSRMGLTKRKEIT